MGKIKKPKAEVLRSKPHRRPPKPAVKTAKPAKHTKRSTQAAPSQSPTIPFLPTDRILLIGEGDFSFSASLLNEHGCTFLVATTLDKQTVCRSKYPQSAAHVKGLEDEEDCRVLYGVDATKLGKPGVLESGGRDVRKGRFDKVVFNFPHVGGLTKDVNRQVRHNQGKCPVWERASTTRVLTWL